MSTIVSVENLCKSPGHRCLPHRRVRASGWKVMFVREAQKNAPMKRKWLFSLGWINLAVGLVILIQFASGQIGNSRDFLNTLLYSLVYSNLTGILGVLLMGGLVERMMLRRLPLFPAVLVCLIPFVAVGCLASQLLLMWIGVAAPKHFWTDYLHTLRVDRKSTRLNSSHRCI